MKKVKVTIGSEGCDVLLTELQNLRADIPKKTTQLINEIGTLAETRAKLLLENMPDFDGNTMGQVSLVQLDANRVQVVHSGEDVGFLEFGTGMIGLSKQHPLSNAVGWMYYVPTNYKTEVDGKKGWYYKDKFTGELIFTEGMVGGRSMLNASILARNSISEVAKGVF